MVLLLTRIVSVNGPAALVGLFERAVPSRLTAQWAACGPPAIVSSLAEPEFNLVPSGMPAGGAVPD